MPEYTLRGNAHEEKCTPGNQQKIYQTDWSHLLPGGPARCTVPGLVQKVFPAIEFGKREEADGASPAELSREGIPEPKAGGNALRGFG